MDERLEEIKERLLMDAEIKFEDAYWLIKQAEKIPELQKENQRHKVALEKIEEEINGNAEGLDAERYLDEAKEIAHKALEESS
ncbi:hypothetical protein [Oceanobacillus locisalsi]|uniref:Uncharacterized protein n=1 Tax=Oceanobacillus locisalsi TaxID=546107 RepID=A0ABW3NJY7_9BACI